MTSFRDEAQWQGGEGVVANPTPPTAPKAEAGLELPDKPGFWTSENGWNVVVAPKGFGLVMRATGWDNNGFHVCERYVDDLPRGHWHPAGAGELAEVTQQLDVSLSTIIEQGGALADLRESLTVAESRLAEMERLLPSSFYAACPLEERFKFMVDLWRRAIEVNKSLEIKLDAALAQVWKLREALQDAVQSVSGGRLVSIGSRNNTREPQIGVDVIERWKSVLAQQEQSNAR